MSRDILESKIDVIMRNVRFLQEYKTVSSEEFLRVYKDQQAAKYSLLETIEACIDIAAHIISKRGMERGESYADMFKILGNERVIDSELASRLTSMARFRNLLVHGYSKIDNLRVLQIIKERLIDIEEFVKQIMVMDWD